MTDSTEVARFKAETAQAAAEAAATKAAAAQAALDVAVASTPTSAVEQADGPRTTDASGEPPAQVADTATSAGPTAAAEQPQQPVQEPVQDPAPAQTETAAAAGQASGSQKAEEIGYTAQVRSDYSSSSPTLPVNTYLDTLSGSEPAAVKGLSVGIPLGLLNRHTLVAGATGIDKTRTLQLLAEGLSAAGVPVFLADAKGDLTRLAEAGASNDKIASHIASIGQDWTSQSFPIELFNLGGSGSGAGTSGTLVRATVTEFGPILLPWVLGLNDTQTSALQLIFHWADSQGLALLDLEDLRTVVDYLANTKTGKEELKTTGGVSAATAGVVLWEIAALETTGDEAFFSGLALDVRDLMWVFPDGRGIISTLELADIQSQGMLFSTFPMQLFTKLFETLPEIGNLNKPTVVFFFDETHLLFSDASKAFLGAAVRTMRLICSKDMGIVFITQSPTDVPDEILAQLGSRVQHALRAHTPTNTTNLKKAVSTFPISPVDLSRVPTSLGTDQAVISVLDKRERLAPVAPAVINVPAAVVGPAQDGTISQVLASSPLKPKYATSADNESAYELLAQRVQADAKAAGTARAVEEQARADAAAQRTLEKKTARQVAQCQREAERLECEAVKEAQYHQREAERTTERRKREVEETIGSAGRQITREITCSILGTLKHR